MTMTYEFLSIGSILLLAWVPRLAAQNQRNTYMNGTITAAVRGSDKPASIHGPVPAIVTVTNTSGDPVSIQLAYPIPEVLRFETLSFNVIAVKPAAKRSMTRTVPIDLAAGASYTATYFLNRYFAFVGPGQATIDWHLAVPFKQGGNATATSEFRGSFRAQLVVAGEQQVKAELARYSNALQSSNRQEQMEAAEALAYLDTPLVVPYLMPMLHIDNLEVIGIHALARHPSPASKQGIRSMLGHRDSAVVGAALEEIDRLNVEVSRSEVQQLLRSSNPNTQWLALGWLAARPSREDLPLLGPLLESGNAPVRDRARSYANRLR